MKKMNEHVSNVKGKVKKLHGHIKEKLTKKDREVLEEDAKEAKLDGFGLLEIGVFIAIAVIVGAICGSIFTYNFMKNGTEKDNGKSDTVYKDEFEEAYQYLVNNYYEKLDKDKLIDAAINGMLSTLDGYTSYMNAEETDQFNSRMQGSYKGIGIEFVSNGAGNHVITNVLEGSPALTAGLKAGDIILKVDNNDATKLTGTQIASYIKGDSITEITMVVKRVDKEMTFKIKTSNVNIPSITKQIFTKNNKKVGYIEISIFADNTAKQFNDALTSLEASGISSLIIDVRDNSGGYLHAADSILQSLLNKGKIMYEMQGKSGISKYEDQSDEKRNYPIAVLINGNSASASEILAAALKEDYNAQLIGTTSYGKGTVQQPNSLSNGGMIKITTDKWLTPSGICIDKVGVKPTTEISFDANYYNDPKPENDNQLQKAIELLAK